MNSTGTAPETRAITLEIELAASPARIWHALTDAQELMRWFPLEARVTPGKGGTMWLSWGYPVVAESTIDVWEPEHRLRTVESRPLGVLLQPNEKENPPRSVEYLIEPSGSKTRLKLVHSGFGAVANWDSAYSAVLCGWEFQFRSLRHYLDRHDGQGRIVAWIKHPFDLGFEEMWSRLMGEKGALNPSPLAGAGEPYTLSPGTGDVLTGTIVLLEPPRQFTGTVANWNDALFRIYLVEHAGGTGLDVSIWLATYGVDPSAVKSFQGRWSDLIKNLSI